KCACLLKTPPVCSPNALPYPSRNSLSKLTKRHVHPDRNISDNLDNLPGRYSTVLDCSELVSDALVLGRKRGDYTRNFPENRCLRKFFKILPVGNNNRQQDVAVIFSRRYPQGTSRGLNNVNGTLLRVSEYDAVNCRYVDALRQTSRIGH